jgi:hypothetical protein
MDKGQKPKIENANQALVVLIQGVQAAQAKGAYSFQDSTLIGQAIEFFEANQGANTPEGQDIEKQPTESDASNSEDDEAND